MNRRLMFAVALWAGLALTYGLDTGVQWADPLPMAPEAAHSIASSPAVQADLSNTWRTPLFSPDRQPDPSSQGASPASLEGTVLTGVILGDHWRVALLTQADGTPLPLHEGQALASGWRLDRLEPRAALFIKDSEQVRLELAPALPTDHSDSPARCASALCTLSDAPPNATPPAPGARPS